MSGRYLKMKKIVEFLETGERICSVPFHFCHYFVKRFTLSQMVRIFRIEFIGITDYFLFNSLGKHIAWRQRKSLFQYLFGGNAGAGMAFTYPCMT